MFILGPVYSRGMTQKIICSQKSHKKRLAEGFEHMQKSLHDENMNMIVDMYYRKEGAAAIHIWIDGLYVEFGFARSKSDSGEYGLYAVFNFTNSADAANTYNMLTTPDKVIRFAAAR